MTAAMVDGESAGARFRARPPESALLVATRQIGDVLLTTPLLRSMRRAWPNARIDVLVYTNKGGMLEGNPDCNAIIASDEHPDAAGYRTLFKRIAGRYDIAVTTQANDRGHAYAWLAARHRVGLVPNLRFQSSWKRASCAAWTVLDNVGTHTVIQNLRLADLLGIPRVYAVVPPRAPSTGALDAALAFDRHRDRYAVLHPFPMWHYKRWTAAGWSALIHALVQKELRIVLTGGPSAEEKAFCQRLTQVTPNHVTSVAGVLSFADLTPLLESAAIFIGPDTSVTHQAAACGCPTLAIYGPTNPVKWGPWPAGFAEDRSPYVNRMATQRANNVLLLQPENECVPCHEEGCDRHKASFSRCLQELPPEPVIHAAGQLLAQGREGAA